MGDPTKAELDAAWRVLRTAGVEEIANISLGELGRIVAGNPNYSAAERRMAGGLLILRAQLAVPAVRS